jgi:hypothetical protein
MTSFIFTRENKECSVSGIDLRNLKAERTRWEEELKQWRLQLAYGEKPIDFTITIEEFKRGKSFKQLKGYFRLVNMILPVIKEQNPDHFIDKDVVDNIIKDRYSYYTEYNGIKTYKSKAKASMEDMIGLIKTAEVLGQTIGLEDCYLSSEEELALREYYHE